MKTCRLKICGLSRFGDILAANDILPDYICLLYTSLLITDVVSRDKGFFF